jgi:phosphohistidine phosphatase
MPPYYARKPPSPAARKRRVARVEAPRVKLYFLRHGVAQEPEDWTGPDEDRPLTKEGISRMKREADAIERLELEIQAILCSPLLRARTTAEVVARRLHLEGALASDDRLADRFSFERLREIVTDLANLDSLMLVGHEPAMSAVLGRLIGNASVEMKKGALAAVTINDATCTQAQLTMLLPPRVLVALGKGRNR